jgi:Porin-like glycoporin RafY
MTRTFKFGVIAAAAFIAAPAFAAVELNANIELDTTYRNKAADQLQQSGRVEASVFGKKEVGAGYVAGKGVIELQKSGGNYIADVWVEGGTKAFAVRLGRFEATDMFVPGKDTYVEGGVGYNGNTLRGRKDGTDLHAMVTANIASGTTFELGLVETDTANNKTSFGVRPVVGFGIGPATVKLALEKQQGVSDTGFAITAGAPLGGVAVNVNYAQMGDANGYGINATMGAFGVGAGAGENAAGAKGNFLFAAYTVPFFIPDAALTFAVSTGKAPGGAKDTGLRARINYAF